MSKRENIDEFNRLLDKVTDPNANEMDEDSVYRIYTLIDKGDVESSDAFQSIHYKIIDTNPNTAVHALKILEFVFYHCGSIMYGEVCTTAYMQCLKDIIKNTEHHSIRNLILKLIEDWVRILKYLPAYSAPKKLLKELQSEGYIFPNTEQSKLSSNESQKKNTSIAVETNDVRNDNLELKDDSNLEKKEEEFNNQLREVQEMKKKEYKKFRKSQGLPTSSDEEDNRDLHNNNVKPLSSEKKKVNKSNQALNNCYNREKYLVLSPASGQDHANDGGYKLSGQNKSTVPKKQLPEEMKKIKESRKEAKNSLQEYRESRKQAYYNEKSQFRENSVGLHKCATGCTDCNKYKKPVENANVPPPKRWPPEIRKVKESKQALKDSFEEYKKSKKDTYYNKTGDFSPLPNTRQNQKEISTSASARTEKEDLKTALLLSELENNPKLNNHLQSPKLLGDLQEQRELELALELSLRECNEDNVSCNNLNLDFQNLSIHQPDSESSLLDWGFCIICDVNNVFLKRFKPCNHKCICISCADSYTKKVCPVCFQNFRALI